MDGVHAVTDVTGFGLAGHALEMARGANLTARLRLDALPWARYCVKCQELIAARIAAGEFVDERQETER